MAKLKIKRERLLAFLKSCSMKGTYAFTSGKATKKDFFSSYFIDMNSDNKLVVLTLNKTRNTSAKFTLKDVVVMEAGIIPITDAETIIKVLKDSSLEDNIEIDSKDTIMTINDGKSIVEIEQRESKDIEELKATQIIKSLEDWDKYHKYNENGILVISKDHPQLKSDLPYPMKITIKKDALKSLIGITLNLTKDNKTSFIYDGSLRAKSVQANSRIKLKDSKIEAKIEGNPFNFDYEFYSFQSIIPNLFDLIEINAKISKNKEDDIMKNYLSLYVVSSDPMTNMESIVAFASIGKEDKSS